MYKLLYVISLLIFTVFICLYPAIAQDMNNTLGPSVTPVITPGITATPVMTPGITATVTPVATPSVIPDVTPGISVTPVMTPGITVTPVVTPSVVPDVTPGITPTNTINSLDPNSINIYIEQGNKYLKEGKYSLAKDEYEKVININDKSPQVWYNLGVIFEAEGDIQSAGQSYKNYLVLSPGAKDAKYIAAHLFDMDGEKLYQDGDYMGAIDKFKEAVKIDKTYPYAYFNQGLVYDKLEEYELATKAYEQAVKFSPSYGNAHFNLAVHYEAAGNYKGAINHYQTYLKIFPKAKDIKAVKAWIEDLKKKI